MYATELERYMACAQEAAQEVLHDVGKIEDPLLRQKVQERVAIVVVVVAAVAGAVKAMVSATLGCKHTRPTTTKCAHSLS